MCQGPDFLGGLFPVLMRPIHYQEFFVAVRRELLHDTFQSNPTRRLGNPGRVRLMCIVLLAPGWQMPDHGDFDHAQHGGV